MVPEERRIIIQTVSDLLSPPPIDKKEILIDSAVRVIKDGFFGPDSPCAQKHTHVICYSAGIRNPDLVEVAKRMIYKLDGEEHPRPVAAILAFAKDAGFGPAIVFNKVATALFGRDVIMEADRELFISQEDYAEYRRLDPEKYVAAPLKGDCVPMRGTQDQWLTYLPEPMYAATPGAAYRMSYDGDILVLHLPARQALNNYYRVRTQLSLVLKAAKKVGLKENDLDVVTIGQALLREGISVKTIDHKLAPTHMVCNFDEDQFDKRSLVTMIQALGRLCGLRRDGRRPILYVNGDEARKRFQSMVDMNEWALQQLKEFPTARDLFRSVKPPIEPGVKLANTVGMSSLVTAGLAYNYPIEIEDEETEEYMDDVARLLGRNLSEREYLLFVCVNRLLCDHDALMMGQEFGSALGEHYTTDDTWSHLFAVGASFRHEELRQLRENLMIVANTFPDEQEYICPKDERVIYDQVPERAIVYVGRRIELRRRGASETKQSEQDDESWGFTFASDVSSALALCSCCDKGLKLWDNLARWKLCVTCRRFTCQRCCPGAVDEDSQGVEIHYCQRCHRP